MPALLTRVRSQRGPPRGATFSLPLRSADFGAVLPPDGRSLNCSPAPPHARSLSWGRCSRSDRGGRALYISGGAPLPTGRAVPGPGRGRRDGSPAPWAPRLCHRLAPGPPPARAPVPCRCAAGAEGPRRGGRTGTGAQVPPDGATGPSHGPSGGAGLGKP